MCAETCDTAALVISELVTNAIVHTVSSRVVCELHDHDDTVRIAVHDEGCAPGEPHPSPQRPDEEHGRGLLLVDALSRAWGAQEHGPGLLVWAELARQTDAAEGTVEPCNDLGWGPRAKPGPAPAPGEGEEAEAPHGAMPVRQRRVQAPHGTAPEQRHAQAPHRTTPEQHHAQPPHGTPPEQPHAQAPHRTPPEQPHAQPPHGRPPEQRRAWGRA